MIAEYGVCSALFESLDASMPAIILNTMQHAAAIGHS